MQQDLEESSAGSLVCFGLRPNEKAATEETLPKTNNLNRKLFL